MAKISVSGGRGKMGVMICRQIEENPDTELVGIIESSTHPDISMEIGGVMVAADMMEGIKNADVVIDFSSTECAMDLVEICAGENKKLVIGTTGFSSGQVKEIKKYSSKIPILLSPNMSVGVNLIFKVVKEITEKLPDYEKEIIEAHHNRKTDSPSGTALKIADIISNKGDERVFGREGKVGPRRKNEVGVHAVRGGNIIGEHTVMWIGSHDRIELTHRAQSRDVFAQGAVMAAVWLSSQAGPGFYTMDDILE